jgi:D-ribulokinase
MPIFYAERAVRRQVPTDQIHRRGTFAEFPTRFRVFGPTHHSMKASLVLGIDVSPDSASAIVAETDGRVLAQARQRFSDAALDGLGPGYHEQNPNAWWNATCLCLRQIVATLHNLKRSPDEIVAAAIDSTSDTVVLLDQDNRPLRPALMHDDQRAQTEADQVNGELAKMSEPRGFRFEATFALPKIVWVAQHEPDVWQQTRRVVHAADFIVGKLTGVFDTSDQSSVLKTGFDLLNSEWPASIETDLGIDLQRLPRVIRSGETIARVSKACAEETGLSPTTGVVAGMVRGAADQIASGARRVGDWNTALGDTLTFRGLTKRPLFDPFGRVYSDLHPLGYWISSSSTNAGERALVERFTNADRNVLNRAALSLSPTFLVVYGLSESGARFPFDRADARGFIEGSASSEPELYAAYLEGIAYVERMAYGVLESLGAEIRERIYTSGNGFNSVEWMQIRADVMGLEVAYAAHPYPAMGSAIVAASRTLFDNIADATATMVQIDQVISPRPAKVPSYNEAFQRFIAACRQRGYDSGLVRAGVVSS